MSFLLIRVDDRLLHGQVALGWGALLHPRIYLLADDRVAADAWELGAYRAMAPEGTRVECRGPAALGREWGGLPDREGTVVLFRGLSELALALEAGFEPGGAINLGGIHASPGSQEILPFLHLTREQSGILKTLLARGHDLFAQELPGGARYGSVRLGEILGGLRSQSGGEEAGGGGAGRKR